MLEPFKGQNWDMHRFAYNIPERCNRAVTALHASHVLVLQVRRATAFTWQGPQKRQLQALREPRGEALNVQLWRVAPLRLQEDLHVDHAWSPRACPGQPD